MVTTKPTTSSTPTANTTTANTTMANTTANTSSSSGSLSPSPSSSTMAAPPQLSSASRQRKKPGPKPKTERPSLIIKLKVSGENLSSVIKPAPAEPVTAVATPTGSEPSPQPDSAAAETLTPGTKRKGVPGPKPGVKRSRTSGVAPLKPGRKKAKLDPSAPANLLSVAGSKLGPKANTGAINDKLRALDRSGKPCKRWTKAGFQLKSFTGIQWTVPTWAAPKQQQQIDENGTASAALSVSENASVTTESPSSQPSRCPPRESRYRKEEGGDEICIPVLLALLFFSFLFLFLLSLFSYGFGPVWFY
ncbi:INO80 complex subunit Ies4-domain-containing protein [Tricharina praecox]|uniref:INO80 complex subunit Ies4-domain-containing protein n=1 Tax=Tricharina praecox TaxID=43433 RepID=UPI002220834F|nr:INO80 complex subunit Ies4-domain-containing protein [Tricharina praecox]KAI5858814.1 INO80 complex subunit Ies4-domain-containing protein [Tricharina praecox]